MVSPLSVSALGGLCLLALLQRFQLRAQGFVLPAQPFKLDALALAFPRQTLDDLACVRHLHSFLPPAVDSAGALALAVITLRIQVNVNYNIGKLHELTLT